MNIIEFDGEIFTNYNGLASSKHKDVLDQVFDELLNENQIYNKGQGHIFINKKVHVHHERKRFIKYGIKPETGPFKHFLQSRLHLFNLPHTELHFTGFFRIEDLSQLAADFRKPGYRLTASNYSYLNSKKLPNKSDFQLFDDQININHKETAYFLTQKNVLKAIKHDQWINELYFPFSEISKKALNIIGNEKELNLPTLEISFVNGVNVTKNLNTLENKGASRDIHRNSPSPKALETMLAAIVDLIKKNHPTDYPTDEAIIASAIELHPEGNGKGLSQTKMKQAFAKGRDHLGIKRQIKPKE